MNLTRRYRERRKERKKEKRVTEEKEERTNPKLCQWCRSFIRRFELEIVLSRLPCRHPYNHFAVGQLNQKQQNRTESVCAEPLFVIPACEPNISRLWLVEIGDRVGSVDGSITMTTQQCKTPLQWQQNSVKQTPLQWQQNSVKQTLLQWQQNSVKQTLLQWQQNSVKQTLLQWQQNSVKQTLLQWQQNSVKQTLLQWQQNSVKQTLWQWHQP